MTVRHRLSDEKIDWWYATVTRIREQRGEGNLVMRKRRIDLSAYEIDQARILVNRLRRRAA